MLYDDEDYELFVSPRTSYYSATQGGGSRHMMVNGSNQRVAIKIKCSDNELYRVSPVYCLLEPGHAQRLQIVRDAGPAKIDKIVMNYIFTDISNPKEAFKELNQLENATFENNSAPMIYKKYIALMARDEIKVSVTPSTNLQSILKQSIHS
ncbi:hypothetical protein WR25_11434 [Diploscapter pachys]|uniref:Major sperm protein n=1 Tax=Diploscapter pachys TaxID=2018661 RepID=A0A2A2JP26_9BILA|nr:hypothetical protein WR25_11434 [Diploscapter pachys]